MRYYIFLLLIFSLQACQENQKDEKSDSSTHNNAEIEDQKDEESKTPEIQLKNPVWVFERKNPNAGKIYIYFTPLEDSYQLDLFIYQKNVNKSIFSRVGFEGKLHPDSSVFQVKLEDVIYSNVKTNDGMNTPFPMEKRPNIKIDLKTKELILPKGNLKPITSVTLSQLDDLISSQKNWEGEDITFP